MGLCIGRQGCVIREMQQKTNTRIQIPSQPTPGQPHRIATIVGSQEGTSQAQAMIDRIVNEQSSGSVMSGTPHHNQNGGQHGGQQQYFGQQAAAGHEHSAEWQAYYAAQALTKQNQAAAAPVAAPAPAASGQGADAYHEQFFRYAYYYGEDAARKYYGAWSPPPGSVNPYGVSLQRHFKSFYVASFLHISHTRFSKQTNPAGITAAPAAQAAAPAPAPVAAPAAHAAYSHAPASAQASQQPVRDTSVRKVSNLPAWMTRGTQ